MSSRQLTRLAMVLAVALVLWGVLAVTRRAPADAVRTLHVPKVDTAAVDTIVLSRAGDTARLVRATRASWRVNGYPAASDAVASLLRGLGDSTAGSEQVAESRASQPRFGVADDSGQRVRVIAHGHTILDIVTGHQTADDGGVYVRRPGDDAIYAMHGGLADALARPLTHWRDKRIVSISPDSVATVVVERATRPYVLHRSERGWRFASGRRADSSAVAALLGQYRELAAVGFATPAEADAADFARSARRVRVLRANGTPLASLEFDSTATRVWARADSGGAVFQLTTWTLGQLMPPDSTLVPKTPRKK